MNFRLSLNDRTLEHGCAPRHVLKTTRCGLLIAFLKGVDKSLAFYVTKSPHQVQQTMSSYHDQDELNGDVFV